MAVGSHEEINMRAWQIGLLTLVCSSCVESMINERVAIMHEDLIRRASFEMNCPPGALALVPLARNPNYSQLVTSYGVSGCGRRAVYVMSANGTWLLNNQELQGMPPMQYAPAPAPATPPS